MASFQLNKRVFSMLITFFERFSTKKENIFDLVPLFVGKGPLRLNYSQFLILC